jgi:acyl carrier protein
MIHVLSEVDMEKKDVYEKVVTLACEKLSARKEKVNENTKFDEDLSADSIDITDFIMELESEFDVEIEDEDIEHIKTIGDAASYIHERIT